MESLQCFICKKPTTEEDNLKVLSEEVWKTIKNKAALRQNMVKDKYYEATNWISKKDTLDSNLHYHPLCRNTYTAVKRKTSKSQTVKEIYIETRSDSNIPKYDKQGLLKGTCVFCGKVRKKICGKEEPRVKIATWSGCHTLSQRANFSTNEHIKSLVWNNVDLIAKEAEYHKSCRALFLKETGTAMQKGNVSPQSSQSFHKMAFASLCSYIKNEILENQHSLLLSNLLDMYKTEYSSLGGDEKTISVYSGQSFQRKLKDHFGEQIRIQLADSRKGNFICSSVLTENEGIARLHNDSKQNEENNMLKMAALHIRKLIMQLPKTKTLCPTNVQNLKDCAPNIPQQLDLFYRTLLNGLTPTSHSSQQEVIDRKVTSMASDAIFNVSRVTIKPWKHTVLGLGVASLTGSKILMEILNRNGHSINYSEAKGLETEIAYTVVR